MAFPSAVFKGIWGCIIACSHVPKNKLVETALLCYIYVDREVLLQRRLKNMKPIAMFSLDDSVGQNVNCADTEYSKAVETIPRPAHKRPTQATVIHNHCLFFITNPSLSAEQALAGIPSMTCQPPGSGGQPIRSEENLTTPTLSSVTPAWTSIGPGDGGRGGGGSHTQPRDRRHSRQGDPDLVGI